MGGSPPQSYVSPDGNYYWDGQKWVPMQQPARQEATPAEREFWSPAETVEAPDPNAPITIGSRSQDGQWWWDGRQWLPVSAPIVGAQAQPSALPAAFQAAPVGIGAAALGGGFVFRQQLGGAAAWSIGFGLVSMVVPFFFNFYFPIMPLIGFLNAYRAFRRGQVIGASIGVVLNALGGLVTLLASGLIGG